VIVDGAGLATHRTGFEPLSCELAGSAGVAVSRARTHWVAAEEGGFDIGSGRLGTVRPGPVLTVGSVVRGPVEIRAARVDAAGPGAFLEFSGWPVTQHTPPDAHTTPEPPCAEITGGRLTSSLTGITGFDTASVRRLDGVSPLGEHTAVPVLRTSATPRQGEVFVAAVVLSGREPVVLPTVTLIADVVTVRWPDHTTTTMTL
jgi:hypothetical protein